MTSDLVADNVWFSYRAETALSAISVRFALGVHAIVGQNGAGKTTLLRVIAGDLTPQRGSVHLGSSLDDGDRGRPNIGYLPQDPYVPGHFTCEEFVGYCAWLKGATNSALESLARRALSLVNLQDRASVKVRTLSGGMRRRVAIAGVLVDEPPIIVMDEPMSALDPEQRTDVRSIIRNLGATTVILYSTHVMQDVPDLCESVVMLKDGRVIFSGTPRQFCHDTEQPLTTEVLEAAFVRRLRP
jgi:ABC-2 type transport system ATP-binding protein